MAVKVYIPTPFRRLTGNRTHVKAEGSCVSEVLDNLEARFPGMGALIFDGERRIAAHVNIYVNNREIHSLEGPATRVADGDELAVIPAIAGGACAGTQE
jgi:molybdopterin converting factor small subunit